MTWINDNAGIFILIAAALILIILLVLFFVLKKLQTLVKNTVDSSLRERSEIVYDSVNPEEGLSISVFNTNFRDIIISSFGFIYKGQTMDFVREYMEKLDLKDYPVVPARASITIKIDPARVERFILDNNFEKKDIAKIYGFVTDSVGFFSKSSNKALRKLLRKRNNARIKKAKMMIHNEKAEKFAASHNGRLPLSHYIWKFFHRSEVVIPALIEKSMKIRHQDTVKVIEKKTPASEPKPEIKPEEPEAATEEPAAAKAAEPSEPAENDKAAEPAAKKEKSRGSAREKKTGAEK